MKAVIVTAAGGPEALQTVELAEPVVSSPTEVKIRLRAAGINPVDTKVRSKGLMQGSYPAVLGCDGAGEVVETGSAVSRFKPGDAVWFCHGGLGGTQGNYAEFNVIDESHLEAKPANLDFVHAAAAPLVLITAWESLVTQTRIGEGHTVLVHAGAGGVGHVAIQIAKLRGARVITTVGSREKAEFARSLGADETILYRDQDFVQRTLELTQGKGADVVYDTVGPDIFKRSIEATAYYGQLVTLLDPGAVELKEARMRNLGIHLTLMLSPWLRNLDDHWARQNQILRQCAEWIDAGKLRLHVADTLPLADAAEAHRLVEAGHSSGKLVLVP